MSRKWWGVVAGLGFVLAAVPALAHHAVAAQYDMDKPIELTGTLKKMEFINPHSMLHLDVANADGTKTTWVFQTTAVAALRQRGLARTGPGSLEPGATYTVKGFAAQERQPDGVHADPGVPRSARTGLLVRRSERQLRRVIMTRRSVYLSVLLSVAAAALAVDRRFARADERGGGAGTGCGDAAHA